MNTISRIFIGLAMSAAANTALPESGPNDIEIRIDQLLARMSVEEKVGQTAMRGPGSRRSHTLPEGLTDAVRLGRVGAIINIMNREYAHELQRIAVEEGPNGIPLVFSRDVIHGFRTIFPIPLGQAASWDPELVRQGARVAAREASQYGVRWTFAPMLDIARDPRWGRIAESFGEDPHLSAALATAMIRGFQTDDLARPDSLAATAKHFAAYGAAEGGRDYNSVYVPDALLRNVYLRPFEAAVENGVASIMSAFNDLNGVPATGNRFLLTDILRDAWGFDGVVVSDWESVTEMIDHGYAADERQAALRAFDAGLDMEMISHALEDNLATLLQQNRLQREQLDERARRVLRMKMRLGLFEAPYFDTSRRDQDEVPQDASLALARQAARDSMVLLKNDSAVLPLTGKTRVALMGPLADAPHEQLGTWIYDGRKTDSRTPLQALRAVLGEQLVFEPALAYSRSRDRSRFDAAVDAARSADVIVFVGGEEAILSGEAHSRANIDLPGAQEELIRHLKAETGKPVVLVVMAGRPLTLGNILDSVDAVLMAWHPGTMAGPALGDLVFGRFAPSGRLPVTWPKAVGQIPIYYNHTNTGRPADDERYVQIDDIPVEAWQSSLGNQSHYLDLGFTPQYPFGFGLSYTEFEYADLELSGSEIGPGETLTVSARVTNTGTMAARETVQLYTRDLVADLTRPVRELKDFRKVFLEPGASATVRFELRADQLGYYDAQGNYATEPGAFHVWVGPSAASGLRGGFNVVP